MVRLVRQESPRHREGASVGGEEEASLALEGERSQRQALHRQTITWTSNGLWTDVFVNHERCLITALL